MKKSINDPFVKEELTGEVKPKKSKFWLYSLIFNIILLIVALYPLFNSTLRFTIFHYREVTGFADGYMKVEQTAKQASSDVLKEWVERVKVR